MHDIYNIDFILRICIILEIKIYPRICKRKRMHDEYDVTTHVDRVGLKGTAAIFSGAVCEQEFSEILKMF